MRRPLRLVTPSLVLATALASPAARAIEFKDLGGRPLTIDVTNTAVASYHFNNRNDSSDAQRRADPKDRVDDDYFDYVDRFNVQIGYWRFRLNVRLDGQAYGNTISPSNVASYTIDELRERGERTDSNNIIERSNQYLKELNTRYHPGLYPAKLSLTYQQPGLDITAGDFYAQLGRGLVLSLRKVDELAIDTTIRGGKIQASKSLGSFRFGGTLLAGQTNPQRVDEATGRVVTSTPSALFFGFPEPTRLQQFDPATGKLTTSTTSRPNFQSDTIFGGRLEGGHTLVQAAANVSLLFREDHSLAYKQCYDAANGDAAAQADCQFSNPVLDANSPAIARSQIRTWSGSLMFPQIGKYADLYVEVAGQQLAEGTYFLEADEKGRARADDIGGYAVYANANARFGALSIGLEGKHYRRFFGLAANVNTTPPGYSGPEFSVLSYSSPPTAEPVYVEPVGAPNVCNSGGRVDARYRFSRQASTFAFAGYYVSFSELGDNSTCDEKASLQTNTWDVAVGGDFSFEKEKSYAKVTLGARTSDVAEPTEAYAGEHGHTFYRETYVRYDVVKHVAGPVSLQTQGFHRHRHLPERFNDPWWEGENYLALQWAPRLSGVFGYEYTSQPGCSRDAKEGDFCHYLNGGITWRALPSDGVWGQVFNSVGFFVGQRRAAIRCVSGVCRQFPAFEGAKLEVVSRF